VTLGSRKQKATLATLGVALAVVLFMRWEDTSVPPDGSGLALQLVSIPAVTVQ
jgi:hypothetical protein